MISSKHQNDSEILAELRKPIEELVENFFPEKTEYQRLRLKQLAWQAVDVLSRTEDVANLEEQKEIVRIIEDIKKLGASSEFIEESLALAVSIYRKLQIDYPEVLDRYQKGV